MNDASFIWNMIVEKLSSELTSPAINTWISPCEPVAFDGSHLVLRTPDEIRMNILTERFTPVITSHLRELLPGDDVGIILLNSNDNYQGTKAAKKSLTSLHTQRPLPCLSFPGKDSIPFSSTAIPVSARPI